MRGIRALQTVFNTWKISCPVKYSTTTQCVDHFFEMWTTNERVRLDWTKHEHLMHLPSSSSKMWSRPTFWPRACLALAPHTMALGSALVKESCCLRAYLLFHLFGDFLVDRIAEILHRTFPATQNNRLWIIWSTLSLLLDSVTETDLALVPAVLYTLGPS